MRIVLASGSPRRRELLTEAGYAFDVIVPGASAECGPRSGPFSDTAPAELVAELALRKAADVAPQAGEAILIACDTVAECRGQVLGKPADADDARAMLRQLSGRLHRVYSGLCVWRLPSGAPAVRVAVTTLRMDVLGDAQLEEYLDSQQWVGKAGGFGFQDRLGWVHVEEGSPSNVVGLPMELLAEMLSEIGPSDG